MTNKTGRKLVIAASVMLCLYSSYKIFNSLSYLFNPLRIRMTFGDTAEYLLFSGGGFLGLLTLGIGGFLLVYIDLKRSREIEISMRFNRAKQIVFLMFVLFSIGSIIKIGYNIFMSLKAYQIYIENGSTEGEMLLPFLISALGIPFSICVSIGGILFGLYILSEKEKIRKIGLALYLIGTIFSLISLFYFFINSMIFYIRISDDFIQYGMTMNQIYKMILSFAVNILIQTACLIIVLYGMKKNRTAPDEKMRNTGDIVISSSYKI